MNLPARVALIDDLDANLKLFTRILDRAGGIEPVSFTSALAALRELATVEVSLVTFDVSMPEMGGVDFLTAFRALPGKSNVPAIVISGRDDVEIRRACAQAGACAFLRKPIDHVEFSKIVTNLLRTHGNGAVEADRAVVAAMLGVASARDPAIRTHLEAVADLSARLSAPLGFTPARTETLRLAASVYDIGKIAMPDRILRSRDVLGLQDRTPVQAHAAAGEAMLRDVDGAAIALGATIAADHHERVDGSGYPHAKPREAIAFEARIVAVADAYVAMTSPRLYREALATDVALRHIVGLRGSAYDERVVDALTQL